MKPIALTLAVIVMTACAARHTKVNIPAVKQDPEFMQHWNRLADSCNRFAKKLNEQGVFDSKLFREIQVEMREFLK